MTYIVDGIKKCPHPEEAAHGSGLRPARGQAPRLSRRTHGADPANREFFHTLRCVWPRNRCLSRAEVTPYPSAGSRVVSRATTFALVTRVATTCPLQAISTNHLQVGC